MRHVRSITRGCSAMFLAGWLAGCAPQLRMVPVPQTQTDEAGLRVKTYDFNGDGKPEYRQILSGDGRVRFLEFDANGDGDFDLRVDRAELDPRQTRHLLLLLDGVPFWLIDEMWQEGHFRLFYRPGHVVGTFPSLTDPAYDRFFHCGIPFGYEACYFDRTTNRLTDGTRVYLAGKNEAWAVGSDYRLGFIEDAIMYLKPKYVFKTELRRARDVFDRSDADRVVLYILSTDGLGHMTTREEAKPYFEQLDRWIERLVYDSGGRLHITMLADHGNNFTPSKFVPIEQALRDVGLHVGKSLRRSGDVVVPKFGLINFASIFCYGDAERARAIAALVGLEGIDVIAWRLGDTVRVLNRSGRATIHRKVVDGRALYRYEPDTGDPLGLADVLDDLRRQGVLDAEGFAPDSAWFQATYGLDRPDAIHRLYTCLTSAVKNRADIVVSLADGWYFGDESLDRWVTLKGTHGGLSRASSVTFLTSTAFKPPDWCRHEEILPLINRYFDWTPHIEGVDYAWLAASRPPRPASASQPAAAENP